MSAGEAPTVGRIPSFSICLAGFMVIFPAILVDTEIMPFYQQAGPDVPQQICHRGIVNSGLLFKASMPYVVIDLFSPTLYFSV